MTIKSYIYDLCVGGRSHVNLQQLFAEKAQCEQNGMLLIVPELLTYTAGETLATHCCA